MDFTRNVLRLMSRTYPTPQNAVDIFKDGWVSQLPPLAGTSLQAGNVNLFDDQRITWANEQVGGFQGMKILELGPLEGGHSYMLQQLGAQHVYAIEANARSFLKCLIAKELYTLDRCSFVLGDFIKFMKQTDDSFDYCLASGVLYHMEDPVELLALIAKVSNRALIWTQYYDADVIKKNMPAWKQWRFSKGRPNVSHGFRYTQYRRRYGLGLRSLKFLGGTAAHSCWMTLNDITSALKHFGFRRIEINFHDPNAANGPAVCLACSKD